MSDNEKKIPVDMTYIGRRLTTNKKLCHAWLKLDGEIALYAKFRPHHCNIGTAFIVDHNENGDLFVNTARNPTETGDPNTAQWEVEDRSAYDRFKEGQLVRHLNKNSAFADKVAPLRKIYQKLPIADRQSFIVMLLKEMYRSDKGKRNGKQT